MRLWQQTRRFRWRNGLDLVASVAMILVAAKVFTTPASLASPTAAHRASIHLPLEPLSLEGLATKGSRQSRVGLILYSDFECPFCRRFAQDVLPVIEKDLIEPGRLLLVFAPLPLDSIHPHAVAAATLAECSRRNGNFWQVHAALFGAAPLSEAIDRIIRDASVAPSDSCLTKDGLATVRRYQRSAEALGIVSTPTFLLGTLEPDGRLRVKQSLTGVQSALAIAAATNAMTAVK
jgi:protein-disulfide isomerase